MARTENGLDRLASGVICQAIMDYRRAVTMNDEKRKMKLESFFESEWYEDLSEISGGRLDGPKLIRLIKENT